MKKKSTTKVISLDVPIGYEIDPYLAAAEPNEVALILDLASRLPRVVSHEKNEMESKLYAARDEGTRQTIQKILEESTTRADKRLQEENMHITTQLTQLKAQNEQLMCKHQKTLDDLRRTETDNALEIANKNNELQTELQKLQTIQIHREENHRIQLDTQQRELSYKHAEETQALQESYIKLQAENKQIKDCSDSTTQIAVNEEIQRVTEQHTELTKELYTAKLEVDNKLIEVMTQKCSLIEKYTHSEATHAQDIANLKTKIEDLQSPLSKGNCGEFNCLQTLQDIGYHVEDTSDGEQKNAGYLDLLVKPESNVVENMRIGVEIKNKKNIRKASVEKVNKREKDIDDDIVTFQQRAKNGIQKGLFDAAIFVSIKAHTKMGAPVVLEMFEDATQRPLAPVTYIGPEKAKKIIPLTQEELETHVRMVFCMLEQCHNMKRDLCNLKDEELSSLQIVFDQMGTLLNKTFADLRKQEQLIQAMTDSLTEIRCRCIQMFRSIYDTNQQIPWLQRKLHAEWMPIYEESKQMALDNLSDGAIWNSLSRKRATISNSIGHQAMIKAVRMETNNSSKETAHKDNDSNEEETNMKRQKKTDKDATEQL